MQAKGSVVTEFMGEPRFQPPIPLAPVSGSS